MKTEEEINPDTEIVFPCDVFAWPTEDTPCFILARKGEKGKVISKSKWADDEWYVQPKNHNPFYARRDEFKIIKS